MVWNTQNIKEKIKKNNLEKYGVEYVLSNDEIRNKIKKSSNIRIFEKYKDYNDENYKILSYENDIFKILHKNVIKFQN